MFGNIDWRSTWAEQKESGVMNLWAGTSPQAGHLAGLPTAASRVPLGVTVGSRRYSGALIGGQRGLSRGSEPMGRGIPTLEKRAISI